MREFPHSLEAEKGLLSCFYISPDSFPRAVEEGIKAEDFFAPAHQIIFQATKTLFDTQRPIDIVLLNQILKDSGNLAKIGGPNYLSEILNQEFSAANALSYVKVIIAKSKLRNVINSATAILEKAYNGVDNVEEFINEAEAQIFKISQTSKNQDGLTPIRDILLSNFQSLEELNHGEKAVTGLETGFHDLDSKTTGFHDGQLVIIAARPGMGKSCLAMNIAVNSAKRSGKAVAFFSLEMSKEELAFRLMSMASKVDSNKIKRGKLIEQDWLKLTEGCNQLSQLGIFIDDRADLGLFELRTRCRRLKVENDLGLIIVDYLQLMKSSAKSRENRQQEIAEISRGLKLLARELEIPIIALSQLNRSLESRNDKRPLLSDLRESGSIEQDADVVIFIYRDEIYDENSPDKGIAEVIVGKQRSGPTGTIRIAWHGQYTSFENLTAYVPPPNFDKTI